MRLLHTRTLSLQEINGSAIPQYAILSHVWGNGEVTFRDMQLGLAEEMQGYGKIKNACSVAAICGFDYIWVDTCCIDKASSTELSEAINSMYRWYQGAGACYAYLADVPFDIQHSLRMLPYLSRRLRENLLHCRWFTRGWTLQELIAPSMVIFLDDEWHMIGTKSSLSRTISDITGIPVGILIGEDDLETATVAQKMSWASRRETTRLEDLAYCLMGIFDIHMPLLYGEGERAFIRLQEEIMKMTDDGSLFAWRSMDENHDGLLATSPAAFSQSSNIVRLSPFSAISSMYSPMTVSSQGIHFKAPFIDRGNGLGLAILNCTAKGKEDMCVAIQVRDISLRRTLFGRIQGAELELLDSAIVGSTKCTPIDLCVRKWRLAVKVDSRKESDEKEIEEILKILRPAPREEEEELASLPDDDEEELVSLPDDEDDEDEEEREEEEGRKED